MHEYYMHVSFNLITGRFDITVKEEFDYTEEEFTKIVFDFPSKGLILSITPKSHTDVLM